MTHPQEQNSEWIEHTGSRMPVKKGTRVDVRHRDGSEFLNVRAGWKRDIHAEDWWNIGFYPTEIVAYRLHTPSPSQGDAQ